MDNQRLILFVALGFVLLLIWQQWQSDYGPKTQSPAATSSSPEVAQEPAKAPEATDVPEAGEPPSAAAPAGEPEAPRGGQIVEVITDVLRVHIDTQGGVLREVDLPAYPVSVDKPDVPVALLQSTGAEVFVAQSGLRSADRPAPDHYASFAAEQLRYQLGADEDELVVPLTWSEDGIEVTKTYRFRRGKYLIKMEQALTNGSDEPWSGSQYRQLQRSRPVKKQRFIYTYTGGVIYSEQTKYDKIDFDEMEDEPLRLELTGGWSAMIEHYFLGAWVPNQDETNLFYSIVSSSASPRLYTLGMRSPARVVEPGESTVFASELFVGPKLQHRLEKIAPDLELTVDYGRLTVISKPLYWILEWIHRFIGNWGWSIILLTILIKLVFYKLSETSYRSMAKMRNVQPRMQALRERYGDDKQRMNQALMELYKTEKINPLGGCLPIVIQIPVFIALYWVLLESVELRQAPFIFWIKDLSTKDPYYVLPVLMGITMFAQQKLNPAPIDPVQQKIMMSLPFVFTVFFAFFPAGLVLYWFTNNLLSIAQQWAITKRMEKHKT
jgi:YidC/Oxa1 family membrane protein insertase